MAIFKKYYLYDQCITKYLGVTFNSCWLYIGNILFCFSKHSFCLQPTIQRSRCGLHSCDNVWEGQSHDQPLDGIFGNQQEFFISLATSWQTPSFFIHYWNRAANIRQSYKLRQTAHRKSQALRNWYFIHWVLILIMLSIYLRACIVCYVSDTTRGQRIYQLNKKLPHHLKTYILVEEIGNGKIHPSEWRVPKNSRER